MRIVVIVPTFNEAENIRRLLGELLTEFKETRGHEMHLLVVDGFSPDGTGAIVREFAKTEANVHLLEKKKEGLGADYIYAMRYAIDQLRAEAIIEMDADFQHDPADLRRFLVQLEAGYDYVIGSRYISGGSIPKKWSLDRRFLSVLGNRAARLILWLPNVTDYTTGFKASRVKGFLGQIDLSQIFSQGYAYKIHLLSEMVARGAKVKEIPITFGLRNKGVSKMEGNNPFESLAVVLKIRYVKSRRFIKFLEVGFLGLVINFLGLRLLVEKLAFHPALANLVSAEAAVISNFYFNNLWTFSDRRHKTSFQFLKNLLKFNLASAFGVVFIQSGLILLLTTFFGRSGYVAFFFVATFFLLIFNFTVYNRIIWRAGK